jgi:glycosyltransferase involved in cell wall biosynthesis
MKILNVVHNPNLDTGGKISHNLLMKELRDRGHEIQFLSTDQYQDFETFHMEDHIDVNSLRLRERKVEKEIRNHLKEHQYDYIYGNGYYAIPGMLKSAQDHNVKTVTHYRDYWFADVNGTFIGDDGEHYKQCNLSNIIKHSNLFRTPWNIYKWQYLKSRHSLLNTADHKIATSRDVRNKLDQYGIEGSKVVPNPVEIERYDPENNSGTEFESEKFTVSFIGTFSKHKGTDILEELIDSFRSSDIRFLLVGEGPEKERLEEKYMDDSNITFTGWIERNRIPNVYHATDVVLYPSTYPEGFGRIAVEAMASGTPIISSKRGGMKDTVIDGETGYLLEPNNIEEWKKKLEKLIDDQESISEMSEKSLEEARKYSVGRHVNEFSKAVEIS